MRLKADYSLVIKKKKKKSIINEARLYKIKKKPDKLYLINKLYSINRLYLINNSGII